MVVVIKKLEKKEKENDIFVVVMILDLIISLINNDLIVKLIEDWEEEEVLFKEKIKGWVLVVFYNNLFNYCNLYCMCYVFFFWGYNLNDLCFLIESYVIFWYELNDFIWLNEVFKVYVLFVKYSFDKIIYLIFGWKINLKFFSMGVIDGF